MLDVRARIGPDSPILLNLGHLVKCKFQTCKILLNGSCVRFPPFPNQKSVIREKKERQIQQNTSISQLNYLLNSTSNGL